MITQITDIFNILLIDPLSNGIVLFYRIFGENLGISIVLFTVALRFILNPLTRPYMESMKNMRKYAGELEKLKARHKGDRTKQMKAQADFYKEKGVNPSAGCVPYILQIVVLIAFFRVFTTVLSGDGDIAARFNEHLYAPLQFQAGEVVNTHFLYLDMTEPDVFNVEGLPFPIPGAFLILASVVQLVSSKIATPYIEAERKASKKTPEKSDDFQVALQSSMVYTFPLITILFGIGFPSGLALYWLVFSLFQFYQQYNSYGWGGATPWIERLGVIELPSSNEQERKKRRGKHCKRAS